MTDIESQTEKCTGTLVERKYWIDHQLTDYPICPMCQSRLTSKNFRTNVKGGAYPMHCSVKCAKRNPANIEKQKQTMIEKYGAETLLAARHKENRPVAKASWGSDHFREVMEHDSEMTEEQMQFARNVIKTNIRLGRTLSTIQICESRFNAKCVNPEVALNESRDILAKTPLVWKHLACEHDYECVILNGEIEHCPHCNDTASMIELAFRNLLTEEIPYPIEFDGRFDAYVPELKIAFEFNGVYWHSNLKNRNKHYVISQTEYCEKHDIKLVHVWEHHMIQNDNLVRSKIKEAIGSSIDIPLSECQLVQLSFHDAKCFLDEHHLLGSIRSKIAYGLKYKSQLVAAMIIGKNRFKQNGWEVYRFAVLAHHRIQGAFELLASHFIEAKHPNELIAYSDRNANYNVPFSNVNATYVWAHRSICDQLSRYKTQKHLLPSLLGDKFDPSLSASENMMRLGWFKLWDNDCRKYTWSSV
jgi:hypothetical protein